MTKKVLSNLNLNQNQLQNAAIEYLSTAPATPVKGQFYWDSSINALMIYNGTEWQQSLSTADKETIAEWVMPDYTSGVSMSTDINTPQLIQFDGLLMAYELVNYVQIDLCDSSGTTIIPNIISNAGYSHAYGGGSVFIGKGNYIKNLTIPTSLTLYPLKGAI